MIAAKAANMRRGSNRFEEKVDIVIATVSGAEAAERMDVCRDVVVKAKKVREALATAAPSVVPSPAALTPS